MYSYKNIAIRAYGRMACFTNPAFKSARMSYRVPTPSAARGIIESVYWKPEIRYAVTQIAVLAPIKMTSYVVNELSSVPTDDNFYIEDHRVQRRCTVLRDVDYVIRARLSLTSTTVTNVQGELTKHESILTRRVARGQYYKLPFFGMSDYEAYIHEVPEVVTPIPDSEDLGFMLWDVDYDTSGGKKGIVKQAYFYRAIMNNGVVDVPTDLGGVTCNATH